MFDWPEDPLDGDDDTKAAEKAALASLVEIARLGKLSEAEEQEEEEGEDKEEVNELEDPLEVNIKISSDIAAPMTPPMGSALTPAAVGTCDEREEGDETTEGPLDAPKTPPQDGAKGTQEEGTAENTAHAPCEVVSLHVNSDVEAIEEDDPDDLVDLMEVQVDDPSDPVGEESGGEDEGCGQIDDVTDEEDIALPCTPVPAPMTPSPVKAPKDAGLDSEDDAVDPGDDWFVEVEVDVDSVAAGRRQNGTRPASGADLDASGAAKRPIHVEAELTKINDADRDASVAAKRLKSIIVEPEPTKDNGADPDASGANKCLDSIRVELEPTEDLSGKDVDAEDETDCLYPEGF